MMARIGISFEHVQKRHTVKSNYCEVKVVNVM